MRSYNMDAGGALTTRVFLLYGCGLFAVKRNAVACLGFLKHVAGEAESRTVVVGVQSAARRDKRTCRIIGLLCHTASE